MENHYSLRNIIRYIRWIYSIYIVRNLWVHWFNPLYTLYFNLVFFPIRQAVRLPVFVYGWPKLFAQSGQMVCAEHCRPGMVRLNLTIGGAPQYSAGHTELNIWGKVIFRGNCVIGSGCKLIVGDKGVLDMGDGVKIMNGCNCTAYSGIRIGAQSWIVHRYQVLDTNFHYIADFKKSVVKRNASSILIGEYCWICSSTTVTGGAVIPDKTIVASNSLVNRDMSGIPAESIVGGVPAKLISTGYRRIDGRVFERKVQRYFNDNPESDVYPLSPDINHSVCDVDN